MEDKIRRILRDFWNNSYHAVDANFIPHIGDDNNCKLCKIEKEALKKIKEIING